MRVGFEKSGAEDGSREGPWLGFSILGAFLKSRKRQKAFTLLEMMIALSLTGLVLLMGSGVYRIFISFQKRYEQKMEHTRELSMLSSQLKKDFFASWDISPRKNGFTLLKRNGEPLFSYAFADYLIIRSHLLSTDTLFFNGIWQADPETQTLLLQDSLTGLPFTFYLPERAAAKPAPSSPLNPLSP